MKKDLFSRDTLTAARQSALKKLNDLKVAYPIAVDFCDSHLYALQLKERGKGPAVSGVWHGIVNTAEAEKEEDALPVSLKSMVRTGRFARRTASLLIPYQDVSVFPLRFQIGRKESLEEAIVRESRKYLPYPVEEAIIDYPSIATFQSEQGDLHKAIVISVHRDQAQKYVSLLEQGGLIVENMESEVTALIRIHERLFESPQNPAVLCHIGHRHTFFVVHSQGGILAQRTIPWGFDSLTEKLSSNLGISGETKAKILLKQYGLVYREPEGRPAAAPERMNIARTIFQVITPLIDELIYEAHMLISYVRSEEYNPSFEGMYIYGHSALIHQLDRYVENRISMPVRLVDPFRLLAPAGHEEMEFPESAFFTLALGLALRKTPWL